jgi:hypothetical protein
MKTEAGRTLAAVGEAQHRVEALKSRIKDLVSAIPLTQRKRLEDSTCAVQAEICALQVAVWRLAGNEASQSSGQESAPVGMKGGARIQKAKHTLIRGCLHRKAADATVSALMPAVFISIESLLLTVDSQGYVLESDSALQNLRVSCSKARSGVDPHHKLLLQAQSASARALMSTKRKVLTLKEWKRQVFPDIWGCRRKKLTGLKVRRPVRVPLRLSVCVRP